MPRWRNWYTRKIEVLMPQGLGVQISPWAQNYVSPPDKACPPLEEGLGGCILILC